MWGNLERANDLESDDKLSVLLYETSGPKEIKVEDLKWKELLKYYDTLVHLDPDANSVVNVVSCAMARNAVSNGNIAALSTHVINMINDILASRVDYEEKDANEKYGIILEGKVRATCGALNLLRIYIHATIVSIHSTNTSESSKKDAMEMCFMCHNTNHTVARDLIQSLVNLSNSYNTAFYDATVFSLMLLIVMLSTQLYTHQLHRNHYFLDIFMTQIPDHVAPLINTTLTFTVQRPTPPLHSIAHHHIQVLNALLSSNPLKPSPDGLYDHSYIVHASAPTHHHPTHITHHYHYHHPSIVLEATRGVIKVSSTILLLPFRLLSLAFRFLAPHKQNKTIPTKNHTIWITTSPISDLASSLLLLLLNNYRSSSQDTTSLIKNPYRDYFHQLKDSNWWYDDPIDLTTTKLPSSITFESLFTAFASSIHNELGALLFYTLLQSSPNFSASITIRFDLDQLVIPLLRTLYTCTSQSNTSSSPPFRSQSQLYLILILLLIFSQQTSFGSDAFRRIILPEISWYKERSLKDISLGSLILLVLLRTLIFNLHKLNDSFLFSNSSAVLLNLSPCMVHLHSYTCMRLVTVLLSIMKRYMSLSSNSPLYSIYKDATYSILQVIHQSLRSSVIGTNLELVYALLYSQVDLIDYLKEKIQQTNESKIIINIVEHVDSLIRDGLEDGVPISATQAMEILKKSSSKVVSYVKSLEDNDVNGDFTFIYEEDVHPEVFFIPYIWEVVVKVVTHNLVEWNLEKITLFDGDAGDSSDNESSALLKNADDIV